MATETPTKKTDTKKTDEPSVEDRLDRVEAVLGLGPIVEADPQTAPPPPPEPLYAPGTEEEEKAEKKRQFTEDEE